MNIPTGDGSVLPLVVELFWQLFNVQKPPTFMHSNKALPIIDLEG